ncbi:MAG: pyridoxal kinase [Robiginitomaculum sp.]|nr:pyridoxal kinase [Robiginitomaculum sp.]
MKRVLMINSQAASSQIGGSAGVFALQRMGIEVIFLPTILVGRHPGWGDPGRVDISADDLSTMFLAVREQNLLSKIDGVFTGYFRSVRQITAACAIIDQIREQNPKVLVAVDPVMGDEPDGLYIPEAVAQAVAQDLVPKADMITPNRWELEFLTDRTLFDDRSVVSAANLLPVKWTFLSDSPAADNWAHMAISADECWKVEVLRLDSTPKGTGDLFAAVLFGHFLLGSSSKKSFETAINSVQDVLQESKRLNTDELPLVQAQERIVSPRSGVTSRPPEFQTRQSRWVAGIDGCGGGWIAVLLDVTGQKPPIMHSLLSFWDVLNLPEQPTKIAVDIPIGFADIAVSGGRKCEQVIRKQLGDRKSSVFSSPCRAALIKTRYEDASMANSNSAPKAPKLSQQSFALFAKIQEIDTRITAQLQTRIFETHPEMAFAVLRGDKPCKHSKKTTEGHDERVLELRSIGFGDEFLEQALPTNIKASRDDLLDACACAWVAQRALLGAAKSYPEKPESDRRGLEMVIRV